ncbi:hypothetical protein WDU94_010612 [Cyamophila willieti]
MDNRKEMNLPNHLSNIKFNNIVVKTRGKVKQVLVRMCHKITREIKKYRNSKADSEEIKKKKTKKANRLAREIKMMKKLNKDDITKFVLHFDKKPDSILNDPKAHIKLKVLVKISQNEIMKKCVQEFRQKYPNWSIEVPNIIRNVEMKKKGLKLNEDIQKGENERMAALAKYPTDSDGGRNMLKSDRKNLKTNKQNVKDGGTKLKGNKKNLKIQSSGDEEDEEMDSDNDAEHKENGIKRVGTKKYTKAESSDDEEEEEEEEEEMDSDDDAEHKENGVKRKGTKKYTKAQSSDDDEEEEDQEEIDSDNEKHKKKIKANGIKMKEIKKNIKTQSSDDEEDDEEEEKGEEEIDSDNSEEERLSRKLSEAFRAIENESSSDEDNEEEEEASGDEENEEEDQISNNEEEEEDEEEASENEGETSSNEEEDEDDDTDSSEDEFEEERRKRKMELIQNSNKEVKRKTNKNNAEVDTSIRTVVKKDQDKGVKKSNKKTNNIKKNNTKKIIDTKSIDRKSHQVNSENDLDNLLKKFDKNKSNKKNYDEKGEVKKAIKKVVPNKDNYVKEEEETVVDDFFFTKDNKEYQSRVKPNPVAEQGIGDGNRAERRHQNTQPTEIYRKGKKIVLHNNRNKPIFPNFDKGGGFNKNESNFGGGGRGFDRNETKFSGDFNKSNKFNNNFSDRPNGSKFSDRKSEGKFERQTTGGSSMGVVKSCTRRGKRRNGISPPLPVSKEKRSSLNNLSESILKTHTQPVITSFQGKKIKFE